MTHKLATWIDQFGTSGCVGCGRCITWCPVGIDITEEAAAIRANPQPQKGEQHGGTLKHILREHPFFAGAPAGHSPACRRLRPQPYASMPASICFARAEPANEFFLIRHGKVALEIVAPGRAPIVFATLGEGEIVGASWLVPPYRWMFDARAVELTRAIGIDAACLRGKCEADHRSRLRDDEALSADRW